MNNELSRIIGKRINALLAEQNKKQKELAAVLGVTDNTVSYFVSGKRMPNTEQLLIIARFFGVTTDYLLGLTCFSTTDHDLRFVCEYTGLEEESVNNLRKCMLLSEDVPSPKAKDNLRKHKVFWLTLLINLSEAEEMFYNLSEFVCDTKRSRDLEKDPLARVGLIDHAEFKLYKATRILAEIAESLLSYDIPELEQITAYTDDNIKELKEMIEYVKECDPNAHNPET